ncbi:MAG: DUF427 domain-containing protein [Sporichthyaceae bacterium]
MALSWQQGPLAPAAVGRFLTAAPLPERLLYVEPLRRRMRVRLGGEWIADSEDVLLLHEPGRYPVAYFPRHSVTGPLKESDRRTEHADFGPTTWFSIGEVPNAAWAYADLPGHAAELAGRVAFVWRAMDGFYEEDERIRGHAADPYHRVDIRRSSRRVVVRLNGRVVANTVAAQVLYETGFAPRWYVPVADVDEAALTATADQTFCPYKGVADHWQVEGAWAGAFSYPDPYPEADRIRGHLSFDPDALDVTIDGVPLRATTGQAVLPDGSDRALGAAEGLV